MKNAALQTYDVPECFHKAIRSIRAALEEMELDIVGELRVPESAYSGAPRKNGEARILLISSPILEFEALALGRAAAVFFPIHMLVSGDADCTLVSVVNPAAILDGRLPAGAGDPIDRLLGRIELAMESLTETAWD